MFENYKDIIFFGVKYFKKKRNLDVKLMILLILGFCKWGKICKKG